MPARALAIPPQPALLVGADGPWLAAADLLSRDLGVVIIDPAGRFSAVAERRGARSVIPPADALNPLDYRAAIGDDGDPSVGAADLIAELAAAHGAYLDDAGASLLHEAVAAAYRDRAVATDTAQGPEEFPTVSDVRAQLRGLAGDATAHALDSLCEPAAGGVLCDRPATVDPHARALHVDLSELPAGERAAGMLLALEDARRRARPDRQLLVVVDDADELFRDEHVMEHLPWLARAHEGVIPRLLTSRPDRILEADHGGTAAAIIRELAIKLISPGDQGTLDTLETASLITPAEAQHLRDSERGELLVIRDGERSFLRVEWLLDHPQHADLLRALV